MSKNERISENDKMSDLLASLKIDSEKLEEGSQAKSLTIIIGLGVMLCGFAWIYQSLNNTETSRNSISSVSQETQVTNETAPVVQPGISQLSTIELSSNAPVSVLEAAGYITARTQATISSKVTGRVNAVFIEEGQQVQSGQLLATLDDSLLRTELDLVQAQLNAEEAGLAELEVELQQAELNSTRIVLLAVKSLVSQAELDQTQLKLEAITNRLNRRQQEIKVAHAKVNVVLQRIQDMQIRAPFAGVVIAKSAQAGEMISPISAGGGFTRTGICTLVDMTSLEIIVDVNEANIQKISVGQIITARLNSYQDWEIPARLLAIIPAADRNKATVRVRIELLISDPRILPDMGVKVSFIDGH